ncbi:hypothetical protein [Candidatus Nanohalovita haloferacivicina]|uniref:hypothetical protein n=1 Tax=Candidatus Nanohalovita haloferacivicina TaxID=2978046 RepID=UPI00325FA525|nr:hypothetical protein HBNXNv_0187 [Candidatus Nanohalobia archaeon BNXNv]
MYRKIFLAILAIFLTASASAANATITLEAQNSQGSTVDAEYLVKQGGTTVASAQNLLDTNLTENENYTVIQNFQGSGPDINATWHDLNLTADISPQMQVINYASSGPYIVNHEKVYALDDTGLNYNTVEITYGRPSSPEKILYCSSYDFGSSSCSSWQIQDTSTYTTSTGSQTFSFNTSTFSAYSAGNTSPRLQLNNITVHNVTGLSQSNKETGGELVDYGTNTTLNLKQASENTYRFSFTVENTGSQNWSIAPEDILRHSGLNSAWPVGQIWYNLNGQKTGGTVFTDYLEWDTSNNGVLETEGSSSQMEASYLVNITDTSTNTYQQSFNATDDDSSASIFDQHDLKVEKVGDLDVELITPPNNTLLRQNGTFYIVANVTCGPDNCGNVTATPRYNTSTGKQIMPENSGQPFHLDEAAQKECELSSGQECQLNWTTNATGEQDSYHLIDVNASTQEGLTSAVSNESLVEIDSIILMDLAFNVIDFGVLDPGWQDRPAEGNSNDQYNISIDENSKPVEGLWVKGTDLTSEADPSYEIGVSNISYNLENNVDTASTLLHNYTKMASNIDPGTILTSYYWIDVPYGMTQSGYNGTITFKANATD